MEIRISVIIPIYKVEKYIKKCVYSVINQNYNNIEVILVDDGSPDDCPQICDDLAKTDSRIKVIHKVNGGLSDARNVGVNKATGDYILFLDSDDYWEGENCLENLVKRAQLFPDIILYGTYDINEEGSVRRKSRGDYITYKIRKSRDEAIQSLFSTNQFPGSAWVVATNRKFLVENSISFIKGIKSEDIDWLLHVFTKANNIDCVNDAFYMYLRGRQGSITNSYNVKSIEDILVSVNKWKPILIADLTNYNKYLLSYLSYQYITTFVIFSQLNKSEQQKLEPELLKHKDLLEYVGGTKAKISKILINTLGLKIGSDVLHMFHILFNKLTILKTVS